MGSASIVGYIPVGYIPGMDQLEARSGAQFPRSQFEQSRRWRTPRVSLKIGSLKQSALAGQASGATLET